MRISDSMMNTTDRCRHLERVEIEAWSDFYRAAVTVSPVPAGVSWSREGDQLISIAANSEVLALNRVIGLGLNEAITIAELEAIKKTYRDSGASRFFVQVVPSALDAATEVALDEAGFSHYNNCVKLTRAAAPLDGFESDLDVREIAPTEALEFARIVAESFGWKEPFLPWLAALIGREGWRHYMAFDDNRPAATGSFFIHDRTAWVDFAATLPDYRGRGAQSALMQRRIADAITAGCRELVVETAQQTAERSAPSYRNMLRFGFEEAYIRPNYILRL